MRRLQRKCAPCMTWFFKDHNLTHLITEETVSAFALLAAIGIDIHLELDFVMLNPPLDVLALLRPTVCKADSLPGSIVQICL